MNEITFWTDMRRCMNLTVMIIAMFVASYIVWLAAPPKAIEGIEYQFSDELHPTGIYEGNLSRATGYYVAFNGHEEIGIMTGRSSMEMFRTIRHENCHAIQHRENRPCDESECQYAGNPLRTIIQEMTEGEKR